MSEQADEFTVGLVCNAFLRCLGDLGTTCVACNAEQCSPRVGIPIRCCKSGERRNNVNALV